MRRHLRLFLAATILLAAAAGAYHFARGGTVVLSFTEAELQQRASALPPYTRTYLNVVQVTVENPRVTLRVRAAVTAALHAYYDRHPIYTLRPTDTRRAVARRVLKDVAVRDGRVHLTLGR